MTHEKKYNLILNHIHESFKNYLVSNNLKSAVIGISGGIDSCVTAAIASKVCDELNIPLIGISLPSVTNKEDEVERAKRTLNAFCHMRKEIYIDDTFHALSMKLNPQPFISNENENEMIKWRIRNGNIKARIRMMYLYDIASTYNGLVLSTDNYTELLLGFWTLHGDVGDFGLIQNLWKSEVYELASYLADTIYVKEDDKWGILKNTIQAKATDGLGVNDKGDLGQIMPSWEGNSVAGYYIVDTFLKKFLELEEIDNDCLTETQMNDYNSLLENEVIKRYLKFKYKAQLPINIKIPKIN